MIELKKVDRTNYEDCIQLKVAENQKNFVAENWYSLLEANYEEDRYPFAIYWDKKLVGFLMYSYYPADEDYPLDSWWIERLMVDKRFQKRGYGRKALKHFIEWFRAQYDAIELRISAEGSNAVAIELYEDLGFEKTGETVDGEVVLLKKLEETK